MTEPQHSHRLDGLEPDNLLAFLALLGLLRALETSQPAWQPRGSWDLENPPLRPVLTVAEAKSREAVCAAAAEGVATLVAGVDFTSATDLKLSQKEASKLLSLVSAGGLDDAGRYFADLLRRFDL